MRSKLKLLPPLLALIAAACLCPSNGGVETRPTDTLDSGAIGTLTRVRDSLELGRQDNYNPVTDLSEVFNGDQIRLFDGGEGLLDLGGQILLELFNDTELGEIFITSAEGTPLDVRLFLEFGGFTGSVQSGAGGAVVRTPGGAAVTVLGTEFFVAYDHASGDTSAGNFGGSLMVEALGIVNEVPGGTFAVLPGGSAGVEFLQLPMSLGEFEEFVRNTGSMIAAVESLRKDQIPLDGVSPLPTEPPIVAVTPETLPLVTLPEGQVVFTCFVGGSDEICLLDAFSERQLTFETATDFYASLAPFSGGQIVFSSRRSGSFEIYSMDTGGFEEFPLTDIPGSAFAPEISPAETEVVFTAVLDGAQPLFVLSLFSDGDLIQLTDGTATDIDPTWSPFGDQIAFASDRAGGTQLFTIFRDGSGLTQVIDFPDIGGRSDWSPDGRYIAFYAGSPGERQIYFIDLETGEIHQVTFVGDNLAPSWSPSGEWLVFTCFLGDNDLCIIRPDGSEWSVLTDNTRSDWQPRWGPEQLEG